MTLLKTCDTCHIGTLQHQRQTYATWYHGHLVVLPGVDAWLCDVCAEFFYDPMMIARIDMLLGSQQTLHPTGERRRSDHGIMGFSSSARRGSA